MKRIKYHARGKFGMMEHPRTHIRVVVRQIPLKEGEFRLGLRGRSHAAIEGRGIIRRYL